MTPSEELRAAAARIRETAGKASGGRWHLFDAGKYDGEFEGMYWVVSDLHGSVTMAFAADEGVTVEHDGEQGIADGTWIALMHPGIAPVLVRWLDGWSQVELSEHGPYPDDWRHALDFARAINGTA